MCESRSIHLFVRNTSSSLMMLFALSISSQSPTLPSSTPRAGKPKPTRRPTTRRWSCLSVGRSVPSDLDVWAISSEPPLDDVRRGDVILPATKCWPQAGEKVIEMSCHKSSYLIHSCIWSRHNQRHQEYSPWKPHYVE